MDGTSILGAMQALQFGAQAVNGILTLKVGAEVQTKAIELNTQIIAAQGHIMQIQSEYALTVKKIESLEKEIMSLKAWDAEKKRYNLEQVYIGALAYVFEPIKGESKPSHWLCVQCFDNHKKSPLQRSAQDPVLSARGRGEVDYVCNVCKGKISVFYNVAPDKPWKGRSPETNS
jgi:hypothetical protein